MIWNIYSGNEKILRVSSDLKPPLIVTDQRIIGWVCSAGGSRLSWNWAIVSQYIRRRSRCQFWISRGFLRDFRLRTAKTKNLLKCSVLKIINPPFSAVLLSLSCCQTSWGQPRHQPRPIRVARRGGVTIIEPNSLLAATAWPQMRPTNGPASAQKVEYVFQIKVTRILGWPKSPI